jgi:hypothetical protein
MDEIIRFKIIDGDVDSHAELMVNTETDIFELSVSGRGVVMSGMWSSNLQQVFKRALEMWKMGNKNGKNKSRRD